MDSTLLLIPLYIFIIPLIFSAIYFFIFRQMFKKNRCNELTSLIGICICFFTLSIILIERDLHLNLLISNMNNIWVILSLIVVYLLVITIYVKIFNKPFQKTFKNTLSLPLISISIYAGLFTSYSAVEIGLIRGVILSLLILLLFYVYKIYRTILIIKNDINKD